MNTKTQHPEKASFPWLSVGPCFSFTRSPSPEASEALETLAIPTLASGERVPRCPAPPQQLSVNCHGRGLGVAKSGTANGSRDGRRGLGGTGAGLRAGFWATLAVSQPFLQLPRCAGPCDQVSSWVRGGAGSAAPPGKFLTS